MDGECRLLRSGRARRLEFLKKCPLYFSAVSGVMYDYEGMTAGLRVSRRSATRCAPVDLIDISSPLPTGDAWRDMRRKLQRSRGRYR